MMPYIGTVQYRWSLLFRQFAGPPLFWKIIGCSTGYTRFVLDHEPPAPKAMPRLDGIPPVAIADGLPISATVHPACTGDTHYPCIDVDMKQHCAIAC